MGTIGASGETTAKRNATSGAIRLDALAVTTNAPSPRYCSRRTHASDPGAWKRKHAPPPSAGTHSVSPWTWKSSPFRPLLTWMWCTYSGGFVGPPSAESEESEPAKYALMNRPPGASRGGESPSRATAAASQPVGREAHELEEHPATLHVDAHDVREGIPPARGDARRRVRLNVNLAAGARTAPVVRFAERRNCCVRSLVLLHAAAVALDSEAHLGDAPPASSGAARPSSAGISGHARELAPPPAPLARAVLMDRRRAPPRRGGDRSSPLL